MRVYVVMHESGSPRTWRNGQIVAFDTQHAAEVYCDGAGQGYYVRAMYLADKEPRK